MIFDSQMYAFINIKSIKCDIYYIIFIIIDNFLPLLYLNG